MLADATQRSCRLTRSKISGKGIRPRASSDPIKFIFRPQLLFVVTHNFSAPASLLDSPCIAFKQVQRLVHLIARRTFSGHKAKARRGEDCSLPYTGSKLMLLGLPQSPPAGRARVRCFAALPAKPAGAFASADVSKPDSCTRRAALSFASASALTVITRPGLLLAAEDTAGKSHKS